MPSLEPHEWQIIVAVVGLLIYSFLVSQWLRTQAKLQAKEKELSWYDGNYGKLLDLATGGALSKTGYKFEVIEELFNERFYKPLSHTEDVLKDLVEGLGWDECCDGDGETPGRMEPTGVHDETCVWLPAYRILREPQALHLDWYDETYSDKEFDAAIAKQLMDSGIKDGDKESVTNWMEANLELKDIRRAIARRGYIRDELKELLNPEPTGTEMGQ